MYPPSFHNKKGWTRECTYIPGKTDPGAETHWDTWVVDAYRQSNYNPISEELYQMIVNAYKTVDELIE